MAEAEKRVAEARAEAARFVSMHAYDGYARAVSPMSAALAGGGPQSFLDRAGVVRHLGAGHEARLERVETARRVADVMRRHARGLYDEQLERTREAERAKQAAARAVAAQRRTIGELSSRKSALAARLPAGHAARVARASRTAGLSAPRPVNIGRWTSRAKGAAARHGDIAANWALTQLGKPYVWAADGPDSYDCSGLTMRAWQRAGVRLDHWTGTQWKSGPHVRIKNMRRGDLVFFGRITKNPGTIRHVGIYIGRGMMVHAPRTGDVVKIAPIWRRDLVGATRPSGNGRP
ncbi:C40 family peptidase [Bailinhaonella thermotolerans]|uniref:C40 family peptidase n=1 Tax=Bailinhaonella thermotolerans TaxID=1070861 RepID=UPI00192A4DEA|nr:C40 family peptidase [Bailinhaonella thermotolerans]